MTAVVPADQKRVARALAFLIADVRGYSAFTRVHGDAAAARLAQEFALIARDSVEVRGGRVIELRGDEALAVFDSPVAAVRAAVELVDGCAEKAAAEADLPLVVGVGIDVGAAVPVEDGFRGQALNTAARLCSTAKGGQVLVTSRVVEKTHGAGWLVYVARGSAELKGFDTPVALFEPSIREVRGGARPQRSDRHPGSPLPVELETDTPLVGRERELSWLRGRWRLAARGFGSVVLLSGPTQSGKTRLAAELAAFAAEDGAHVVYVDAGGTGTAVALSLLHETASAQMPTLLVIDDLEALGDRVASRVDALGEAIEDAPALVLVAGRDVDGFPALSRSADQRDGLGDTHRILRPLDPQAIRELAELYSGSDVSEVPLESIARSSGGWPGRVHELMTEWVELEAPRRLAAAAEWMAAARATRKQNLEFANNYINLKLARLYGEDAKVQGTFSVCPYKGLASFEADDAGLFFGRERLVGELAARTVATGLVAVVGPSGSGKSSLIAAGLVPSLAVGLLPGSDRWLVTIMRPNEHPLAELARAESASGDVRRAVLIVDQFEEVFTLCSDEQERADFIAALTQRAQTDSEASAVLLCLRGDFIDRCTTYPALAELISANQLLVGPMTPDELRRAIERPARRAGLRVETALVDALVAEVADESGGLPLVSTALVELWQQRRDGWLRMDAYERTGGVRRAVARLAESSYEHLNDEQRSAARRLFLRLVATGEEGIVTKRRVPISELDLRTDETLTEVVSRFTTDRLLTASGSRIEVAHEALLREWPRFQEWLSEDAQLRELREHLTQAANHWDAGGRDASELYRGARLTATLDWAATRAHELNELERGFLAESRAEAERELVDQRRRNRRLRVLLVGALVLLAVAALAGLLALVARGHAAAAATLATAERLGAQALTARDLDTSLLLARQGVALNDTLLTQGNLEAALLRSPAAIRVYRPLPGRLDSVDTSPSGAQLLFGNDSGTFAVLDRQTGRVVMRFEGTRALFGRDGRVVVASGETISLLDPRTGRRTVALAGFGNVNQVALARTENEAALGLARAGGNTLSLHIVALPSGRVVHVVSPLPGMTFADAGFSNDGRILVAEESGAAPEPSVDEVWSLVPWRRLAVIRDSRTFSTPVTGAIAPDDRSVVAGHPDGSVTVYSFGTGKGRDLLGRHNARVVGAGVSLDGRTVVTTGDDAQVIIWDAATGALREAFTGHAGRVFGPAFGPTGSTVYTVGLDGLGIAWDLSGTRRLSRPFHPAWTQQVQGIGGRPVTGFGMSPDGRMVAVPGPDPLGADQMDIQIVDVATGKDIATLGTAPSYLASSIAWSADGKSVAAVGPFSPPSIWPFTRGAEQTQSSRTFALPSAATRGTSVALSPDGKTVAIGADDGRVYRFSVTTGAAVGQPLYDGGTSLDLAFSPNGRELASAVQRDHGAGGAAFVWRARDGKNLYRVTIGGGSGDSIAFSPSGRLLATGGADGEVNLWDAGDGRPTGKPLRGNAGAVVSLAFSPDGRQLVSGGSDGTTRIFDVATGSELGSPLPGLDNVWVGARFTPDGQHVISYYSTGNAFTFDMRVPDWEQHACSVAGRRLTRGEWAQYLPGLAFRPTC